MNDPETQRLLKKFSAAWARYTHATDSDARYEAKGDYQQYAVELALWMMNCPTTDTPTELDPIRGNSPDECENPDRVEIAASPTVRAIVLQIYTAAQQSRRTSSAFDKTLLYIAEKEKEASKLKGPNSLKNTLWYVKATCDSTRDPAHKIARIEQITAQALNLPFQAVQSRAPNQNLPAKPLPCWSRSRSWPSMAMPRRMCWDRSSRHTIAPKRRSVSRHRLPNAPLPQHGAWAHLPKKNRARSFASRIRKSNASSRRAHSPSRPPHRSNRPLLSSRLSVLPILLSIAIRTTWRRCSIGSIA